MFEDIINGTVANVIMYILLLLFVLIIVWVDISDQGYPDGIFSDKNLSFDAMNSKILQGTKVLNSDTPRDIVDKINKAVLAESSKVKWRTAFILATVIALAIWLFLTFGLPNWVIFYLTILIPFIVIYFYFSFTSFHTGNPLQRRIDENLKLLLSRKK